MLVVVRPPAEIDDVDWNAFSGPTWFRGDDVREVLQRFELPGGDGHGEGRACALAYGNDHAGTLYRAAPHAVPFLAWFVAHGHSWARTAAAAVLEDGVFFSGEPEFPTTITAGGDTVAVEVAFRAEAAAILAAADTPEIRGVVAQLLAALDEADAYRH
jgi:hypothetical protein